MLESYGIIMLSEKERNVHELVAIEILDSWV